MDLQRISCLIDCTSVWYWVFISVVGCLLYFLTDKISDSVPSLRAIPAYRNRNLQNKNEVLVHEEKTSQNDLNHYDEDDYENDDKSVCSIIDTDFHLGAGFDEERLSNYFSQNKSCFTDIFGNERLITDEMFNHTPVVEETSIKELCGRKNVRNKQRKRSSKLSDIFQSGTDISNERLTAIIGDHGCGKSVYLQTLKSYYVKQGLFAFSFGGMSSDLLQNVLDFPELLASCAIADYQIDDIETFGDWLEQNEEKCVFLIDDFVNTPSANAVNVCNDIRFPDTVDVWLSLLLSGKIMKNSKVIFTALPSSVAELGEDQLPDKIYKLVGFSDEGMSYAVSMYNSKYSNNIISFITSKGFSHLARSPCFLALISLCYTPSTRSMRCLSITQLYNLFFQSKAPLRKGQQTEKKLVDRFYYVMFKENKLSFTEEDVLKHDLTAGQVMNHSFVSVSPPIFPSSNRKIEARKRIFTPRHQSFTAYHISRHIMANLTIEEFDEIVQKKLFAPQHQPKWSTIRRFIAGHINDQNNHLQRIAFLKQMRSILKNATVGRFIDEDQDKHENAFLLSGYLYNDLLEIRNQRDFLSDIFDGRSDITIKIKMQNAQCLEGQIWLFQNMDPHIRNLQIILSDDFELKDFRRLTHAIDGLSCNVRTMEISNIRLLDTDFTEEFSTIIRKVDWEIWLDYDDEMNDEEFEMAKQHIQSLIDILAHTKTVVRLKHRGRRYLIRHQFYTNSLSSNIKESQISGQSKTFNMMKKCTDELLSHIVEYGQSYPWDFMLTDAKEIASLDRFLYDIRPLDIGVIHIYVPIKVEWDHIRLFCKQMGEFEGRAYEIYLFNLSLTEIGFCDVEQLFSKVKSKLKLTFLDDISETEVYRWKNNLISSMHPISPLLDVSISFNNYRIHRSGSSTYFEPWEIIF